MAILSGQYPVRGGEVKKWEVFGGRRMPEPKLYIIDLRSAWMLVSRKKYRTWRQIQEEYPDYMASLGPWPLSKTLNFLENEYSYRYTAIDGSRIHRFLESSYETLALFH